MFKKLCITTSIATLFTLSATVSHAESQLNISKDKYQAIAQEVRDSEQCLFPHIKFSGDFSKRYSDMSQAEINAMVDLMGYLSEFYLTRSELDTLEYGDDNLGYQYFKTLGKTVKRTSAHQNIPTEVCGTLIAEYTVLVSQNQQEIDQQQQEQEARWAEQRRQAELEKQARNAYYATPEGQAELAQQQIKLQQMQQQQTMALMAAQQRRHDMDIFSMQMNNTAQSINNSLQNLTNQYNNYSNQMTPRNVNVTVCNPNSGKISWCPVY